MIFPRLHAHPEARHTIFRIRLKFRGEGMDGQLELNEGLTFPTLDDSSSLIF